MVNCEAILDYMYSDVGIHSLVCSEFILFSDIPYDHRHGLNQSVSRISRPDFTIRPPYSVVCRMWAITLPYVGNKQY